jgi:hypothetical protein
MRMQPKAVRDKHALMIALTFTGLVAGAWLFTRIQSYSADQEQVASETQPPFSGLLNQVKDQWAAVQETFSDISDPAAEADEAEPSVEMSPESLQLSEETLEKVRRESTANTDYMNTEGETEAAPVQEVQIVTVSSTATTTVAETDENQ